jgi:hypothetical protein
MPVSTIDEVLLQLDNIIASSIKDNNYLGIFAYVYRKTTAKIKEEVEKGSFEDNARMQAMDIIFADLYLQAYQGYRMNSMISVSWHTAFHARYDNLTIIQHIMLGMNAHINLDLGIAAAKVMEGKDIQLIEPDFMKVNDILASLVDEMQQRVERVSRLMFILDWVGGRKDEQIINFSMAAARKLAWSNACDFSKINGVDIQEKIYRTDKLVNAIALEIRSPKSFILRKILKAIKYFEEKKISRIIERLESEN